MDVEQAPKKVLEPILEDDSNESMEEQEFKSTSSDDYEEDEESFGKERTSESKTALDSPLSKSVEPSQNDEPESVTEVRRRRYKQAPVDKGKQKANKEKPLEYPEFPTEKIQRIALAVTFAIVLGFGLLFLDNYDSKQSPKPISIFFDDTINGERQSTIPMARQQQSVQDFLKGYARMRDVCEVIAKEEGWYNVRPEKYDPTSALSALPSQPYFCINHLLNAYAGEDVLSMRRRQEQKWASVKAIQNHVPSDAIELAEQVLEVFSITHGELDSQGNRISKFADLSHASIAALGYLHDTVLFRDIDALADSNKPLARISHLKYKQLRDLASRLTERRSRHDKEHHCICGPHMNMARSVVLSITPDSSRLFIEPKIEKLGKKHTAMTPDELAWRRKRSVYSSNADDFDALIEALEKMDDAILSALDFRNTATRYYSEITVESIRLETIDDALQASDGRVITSSKGPEAHCVQYCHQIAYGLLDIAPSLVDDTQRLVI